jgi:hypothetical protein
MKLVDAIEVEIGPVETWPTSIPVILFTFDPTKSIAVYQLTRLIAFWYGNNVPLSLASQFCSACCFRPLCAVRPLFTELYGRCSTYPPRSSSLYNDLCEQTWKYTDGRYSSTFSNVPTDGYEHCGFPMLAFHILRTANHLEYVEGA